MEEFNHIYTGNILPFPTPFSYKDEERYKETTSDEYLVDDTGYVTLEEQIKRCFRERRVVDEAPGLDDEFVDGLPEDDDFAEELPEDSGNSELSPGVGEPSNSETPVENPQENTSTDDVDV